MGIAHHESFKNSRLSDNLKQASCHLGVTKDQSKLLLFEYGMAVKQKIAYDGRAWTILIAFIALAPTALALTAQVTQAWMVVPPCLLLSFSAFVWLFVFERYAFHVRILDERMRDIERILNGIPLDGDPEKYPDRLARRSDLVAMKTELAIAYYLSKTKEIELSNMGYNTRRGRPQKAIRLSADCFARTYVLGIWIFSASLVAVKFNLGFFAFLLIVALAIVTFLVLVGLFRGDA